MAWGSGGGNWQGEAQEMVRRLGLPEGPIAGAMRILPRHRFVPRVLWERAYVDTPLPLGSDATISAPHMVALLLEWADLKPGLRVLELGSGCGYLAALASLLVGSEGSVVGVELEPDLVESSRFAIEGLGLSSRVDLVEGDAVEGYAKGAPYDRILVSFAASPPLPESWALQLGEDGFLVAPIAHPEGTALERWRRSLGEWQVEKGPPCLFVAQKHGARGRA